MERAVYINSLARCMPTARGRVYNTAMSGTRPIRPKTEEKVASSAARTKSACSARARPPPKAKPFTAAITGQSRLCRRTSHSCIFIILERANSGWACLEPPIPLTLPPAQKARPVPVRIKAFTSSLPCTSSSIRMKSSFKPGVRAFKTSGRFMVKTAIPLSPISKAASVKLSLMSLTAPSLYLFALIEKLFQPMNMIIAVNEILLLDQVSVQWNINLNSIYDKLA